MHQTARNVMTIVANVHVNMESLDVSVIVAFLGSGIMVLMDAFHVHVTPNYLEDWDVILTQGKFELDNETFI